MNRIEYIKPGEIEKRSFEIISEELNKRGAYNKACHTYKRGF